MIPLLPPPGAVVEARPARIHYEIHPTPDSGGAQLFANGVPVATFNSLRDAQTLWHVLNMHVHSVKVVSRLVDALQQRAGGRGPLDAAVLQSALAMGLTYKHEAYLVRQGFTRDTRAFPC